MNWLHLLWIVLLSSSIGALVMGVCVAGKDSWDNQS